MEQRKLITFLSTVNKLKDTTRHCYTVTGRKESVAEHSWRLALMAMLLSNEYPHLDINKVIKMCLIHDLGEAITGDIPSFYKTEKDEKKEDKAIEYLLSLLPSPEKEEIEALYAEMNERKTDEAKLYKALDKMEAVIAHNESPISTWIPLEYTENLIYGEKEASFSKYTDDLRKMLKEDTEKKIKENK